MIGQNGNLFGDLGLQGMTIGHVYLGDRLVFLKNPAILTPMPVILWDKQNEEMVQTSDFMGLNKDRYEPVGIVVIPTSHDVYGTGECGVMALMVASLTTPDTGQTSNVGICWGAYGTDYPELVNYDAYPSYGTQNIWAPVQLKSGASCLPSDQDSFGKKLLNPNGEQSSWYYYQDNYNHHAPSPYNEDGTRNPDYYDTGIGTNNALSDFAGKSNTEFLCSKSTAQENWRTDMSITNNSSAGYHPAACACWRYHTLGTSQGDWYLPACGELGYVCVRYKLINETIAALQTWSGKIFYSLVANVIWSSSECDFETACLVYFHDCSVYSNWRGGSYNVRPFTRMIPPKRIFNSFSGTTSSDDAFDVDINGDKTVTIRPTGGKFKYRDSDNITTCEYMFDGCSGLTSLDLSNWDVSNVIYMNDMFNSCEELTSLDLSNWDVSNVTEMTGIFAKCYILDSIEGLSNWDVSNVTYMDEMFSGCSGLTSLDLSNWDVSNVTNMYDMFSGCSGLTSLDLSNWDVSNVTNMNNMFSGCSGLTSLDLSNWDVSNVTNMCNMFGGCSGLTSLDLSNWDVSNVTNMNNMFRDCEQLNHIICTTAFQCWCWANYDIIKLPVDMQGDDIGWEIVDA